LAAIVLAFLSACGPQQAVAPLPALGAKIDATSVSGISSGAYMAGQFQMAHAKLVAGAAIIAGGPYGCAESVFAGMMPGPGAAMLNVTKAVSGCMQNAMMIWGVPNTNLLAEKAERLAGEGRIDPVADVKADRIYLFTGSEDRTVVPPIVRTAKEFYERLGVPAANIVLIEDMPAGHAFVTESDGGACDVSGAPYIVDCDYDQAGALLGHIYGTLKPRAATASGTYAVFDQRPFTDGLGDHGLSAEGMVYVPETCRKEPGCRVHIAFHGCAQNRGKVGDAFVKESGFDRWADTNRFVVLFPQTEAETLNPQACWDWWGYTGRDYLTSEAPQIEAVHRMLQRLGQAQPPS
jgi:poly(3-hydroxybutyrate) depolymerase